MKQLIEKQATPNKALKNFFRQHGIGKTSAAWRQWVNSKEYEHNDLARLLTKTVRPEFKKKAIAILLAPDFTLLPRDLWKWGEHDLTNMVFLGGFEIEALEEDLRTFTAELILRYSAIVYKTPDTYEEYVPLRVYQPMIVRLLCLLDPSDLLAERLFSAYLFNDWRGFRPDFGDFSPLRHFLASKELSEEWKRRGDFEMRKLVDAEAKLPMNPYERRALWCYTQTIQNQSWHGLSYSRDLLAEQITFLLNLPRECDWGSFFNFHPRDIVKFLGAEKYKELRHRYAQCAFSVIRNHFLDDDDYAALKTILNEFNEDIKLCERIRQSIAIQQANAEKKKKEVMQNDEQEEVMLNALR